MEQRNEEGAEIPFDNILDRVTGLRSERDGLRSGRSEYGTVFMYSCIFHLVGFCVELAGFHLKILALCSKKGFL
jgi:hypothetical protein